MNKQKLYKSVIAALFAALTCVATMVMQIPSPMHGYVNLGDCFVLLSAWLLGPVYGVFSAAIGSALADIISGYVIYAPATLIIKGLMALVSYFIFKALQKSTSIAKLISGLVAEIIMVAGYLLFDGVIMGYGLAALADIPGNSIQGAVGIVCAFLLHAIIVKTGIDKEIFKTNR